MKSTRFTQLLAGIVIFSGLLGVSLVPSTADAFVQKYQYSEYAPANGFAGIWDGLLAPYSLIARWFMDDVVMYAEPNTGWFYDAGFLIGIAGSIPFGWLAAIISTLDHIFSQMVTRL